jgi:hypothetical protein
MGGASAFDASLCGFGVFEMMTGYYRHRNAARQRMGHAIAVWYVSMPQRASLRVFGECVWRWN